jgi:hypothetical protein
MRDLRASSSRVGSGGALVAVAVGGVEAEVGSLFSFRGLRRGLVDAPAAGAASFGCPAALVVELLIVGFLSVLSRSMPPAEPARPGVAAAALSVAAFRDRCCFSGAGVCDCGVAGIGFDV